MKEVTSPTAVAREAWIIGYYSSSKRSVRSASLQMDESKDFEEYFRVLSRARVPSLPLQFPGELTDPGKQVCSLDAFGSLVLCHKDAPRKRGFEEPVPSPDLLINPSMTMNKDDIRLTTCTVAQIRRCFLFSILVALVRNFIATLSCRHWVLRAVVADR
jgi:hypothetical protein